MSNNNIPSKPRQLFVNLAVKDLRRSMDFFTELGFEWNLDFTDENAACMLIGRDSFAMLLQEKYFSTFTSQKICDTGSSSEVLLAVSCDSRDEVDSLTATALEHGAVEATAAKDMGFMYVRTFYDLDRHHWEVMHMDMDAAMEQQG